LALWGADLGLWDWDARTDTITCKGPRADLVGCRLGETHLSFGDWEKQIHPQDLPAVRDALRTHLENRAPFFESEYRLRYKNEAWNWVLIRGKVIERDRRGQFSRACGIVMDIGQRKKLEAHRPTKKTGSEPAPPRHHRPAHRCVQPTLPVADYGDGDQSLPALRSAALPDHVRSRSFQAHQRQLRSRPGR